MKRRWFAVWLLLVAPGWLPGWLSAQGFAAGAGEITVRMFSTARVRTLRGIAAGAMVKTCDRCPAIASPGAIEIVAGAKGGLLVNGKPVHGFYLQGQLRVQTDDGRTASAAGKWKASVGEDGLHLAVTLPSERYVMAVLQSEAAPDEPMESLKALAVAARSFALMNPARHGLEGLCDSTHCQALRLREVRDDVRHAVRETAGETLWSGRHRVAAYFTQNCGGQTADGAEVWGGGRKAWLSAHPDPWCQRKPAMWQAVIRESELRAALRTEGLQVPAPLQSVRVAQREASGRALKVELMGRAQRVMLPAASLRFAVNRALGWNTMRSDWYQLESRENKNPAAEGPWLELVFVGKGYGHGVGLCQAGAAEMAGQGRNYRDILSFYFPETRVQITDSDNGWKRVQAHGWTLQATGFGQELTAQGDSALARAMSLWPGPRSPAPVVMLAPTTELFRQMSGEPGWALAATRGNEITLQPLAVMRQHGTLDRLLLHEFLHSEVEAEANSSKAPLWLREGLVEMLTGGPGQASQVSTAAQVEAALRQSESLAKAQEAHRAAAALVRRAVASSGLQAVRGWLQRGVPAGALAGQ